MRRPNPIAIRRRSADLARDAFLRAAAALTEPLSANVVAFALLEASVGMVHLAESDDAEQRGRALVIARLQTAQDRRMLT